MTNKLLLSGVEIGLIVVIGVIALVFLYLIFGRVFASAKEKISERQTKKVVQKAFENSGEITAQEETKKEDNKKDKYNEVLEKIHQNRQQYFTEIDPLEESKSSNAKEKTENNEQLSENLFKDEEAFIPEDFDVLEKIDFSQDQNFDFDQAQPAFDDQNPFIPDANYNFASEFKRKRMIKRNQTIGSEINSCSSRIKAIIALDILNKTKF